MSGVHSDLLFPRCLQLRHEWCSFWSLVFKLSSVTPSWVVFILISCFKVVFSYAMSGVHSDLLFSSCLQLRHHEWCSFWSLVFKLSSVTPWVVFILISCFQVVFSYAMSGVHSDLLFSSCLQLRHEWCSFWSLVSKLSSVTPWVVFILISCFQVVFSYAIMSGVHSDLLFSSCLQLRHHEWCSFWSLVFKLSSVTPWVVFILISCFQVVFSYAIMSGVHSDLLFSSCLQLRHEWCSFVPLVFKLPSVTPWVVFILISCFQVVFSYAMSGVHSDLLFSSCLQLRHHEWCSFWSLVFKLSSVTPWVVFILISWFQVAFSYAMSGVHSDLLFPSCLQLRHEWCSFWSLVFKLSSVTPSWVVFANSTSHLFFPAVLLVPVCRVIADWLDASSSVVMHHFWLSSSFTIYVSSKESWFYLLISAPLSFQPISCYVCFRCCTQFLVRRSKK